MERTREVAQPLLLTVPQVARMLNIGNTKVRMLLSSGELPRVRIGRSVRVPAAALHTWLEQCEQRETILDVPR